MEGRGNFTGEGRNACIYRGRGTRIWWGKWGDKREVAKSVGRYMYSALHLPCGLLDRLGFRMDNLVLLEFLEVGSEEGALKGI